MKLTIARNQEGFGQQRKYVVACRLELNDPEIELLQTYSVPPLNAFAQSRGVDVGALTRNGYTRAFPNVLEATLFEHELRDACANLVEYLHAAQAFAGSDSYEFQI